MRIKSVSMIAMAIALGAVAHAHATDPAPASNPITTKLYVDNKFQDKITAHAANAADSVLTDSTTTGNVQKRAIFDGSTAYVAGTHATHIPTMGAVTSAISNNTSKIAWGATETTAVQKYSTTFDGTTNNWPAADAGKLVDGTGLATALAEKQNKIAANNATTYPNGSVVTYGATAGTPGQVAIATAPSYNQQTGALENGTQIASIAAVNTMQRKRVCVGWATGHENDDDYCYFWDWPD